MPTRRPMPAWYHRLVAARQASPCPPAVRYELSSTVDGGPHSLRLWRDNILVFDGLDHTAIMGAVPSARDELGAISDAERRMWAEDMERRVASLYAGPPSTLQFEDGRRADEPTIKPSRGQRAFAAALVSAIRDAVARGVAR